MQEFAEHVRADTGIEDTTMQLYIKAATEAVSVAQGRQLLTAEYELTLPSLSGVIELPRPPLQSVEEVRYRNTDGDWVVIDDSVYAVKTDALVGCIYPAYGEDWPTNQRGYTDDVVIEYTAGYGLSAADVPATTRHAILLIAAQWFEHREAVVIGASINPVPFAYEHLVMADSVTKPPVYS